MQLNTNFISNVHDIFGEAGDDWLKDLINQINHLSKLWDFHFLNPVPNLSYNFVSLVKMNATGKIAILKMSPEGGNLIPEMRWLNCIEKGVPEIYALNENLNAYLMEYLEPGHSLKSLVRAGDDDGATRIICHTIRDLQSQHCSKMNFRPLSDFTKTLPVLEGKFDARLLSKAQTLFQELTADSANDIILHGDLHHDNILSSNTSWKAIDPHGYVGDPAAEVGAMIRNAFDCFPDNYTLKKIVENRLNIMANELPFDPQRIKSWAFCITVLSGAWSVEDHGSVPELVVDVATAVDQLMI